MGSYIQAALCALYILLILCSSILLYFRVSPAKAENLPLIYNRSLLIRLKLVAAVAPSFFYSISLLIRYTYTAK